MAELTFLQQGIRQVQVQREVFLGFAVTASIALIGLFAHTKFTSHNAPAMLAAILLIAIIAAQVLTIRNTWDVIFTATYIRLFIESKVEALNYQTDLLKYESGGGAAAIIVGSRFGYAITYGLLSLAPLCAYATLATRQTTLGYAMVCILTLISIALSIALISSRGGKLLGYSPVKGLEAVRDERERESLG